MAAKFFVIAFLVVAAQGSAIHDHGADYTSFSYDVSDPHTGDVKSQHETRVGDNVVGQYSLWDSDGTKRTVDYAADAHNGFNAVVRKDPLYAHAAPVIAHAAPVVAAPLAHTYAAPVVHGYSAPLAHSYAAGYATPLAHGYAAPLATGYSHGAIAYGAHGLHGADGAIAYGAHGLHGAHGAIAYGAHGLHGAHGAIAYGAHGLHGAHGLSGAHY